MTYGSGFSIYDLVYGVALVALLALSITLAVLLIRTLLAVIRALGAYTRERELRIDLMLADDAAGGPVPPVGPGGPGGPSA
jgi:hypothetical protein